MICVSRDSANIEFSLKEFEKINDLASKRIDILSEDLKKCDSHEYLELLQLKSKIDGVLNLMMVF